MANPLGILAGIATSGAQGATGAYTGEFEGQEARKKHESEDLANRMKTLQMLQAQQSLGPQYHTDAQGRQWLTTPGQPPQFVGFAPKAPPTEREIAATAASRASEAFNTARTANLGVSKTPQIPAEHAKMFEDWQRTHPGGSYLDFWHEEIKPTTVKEPASLTAALMRANDPKLPKAERDIAQKQADAIRQGERDKFVFNVNTRTDASGKEFDRRQNVRDQIKQRADERKQAYAALTLDQKREAAMADTQSLRQTAKELDNAGLLPPSGATGIGMWVANKKRDWLDPTNDYLVSFRGRFGQIMVGEIDRSVYDEKGVRAIQAFRSQFDMVDKIPSYSALNQFLTDVDLSIERQRAIKARGVAPTTGTAPTAGAPAANDPLGIRR